MYAARSSVNSDLTIGSGGDGGRSPRPTRRSGIVSGAVPDPRLAVCAVLGATRRASPSGESHFSCRFLQKSSPGRGELKPLTERGGVATEPHPVDGRLFTYVLGGDAVTLTLFAIAAMQKGLPQSPEAGSRRATSRPAQSPPQAPVESGEHRIAPPLRAADPARPRTSRPIRAGRRPAASSR